MKVDVKRVENQEFQTALKLMKKVEAEGYEILIVGGFVRDLLLGRNSDDIDLSTNCPEDVLSTLFETFDIGKSKSFGISVVKLNDFVFEVAQFRQDIYERMGKGASFAKVVNSFKSDAARRDFTINALGLRNDGTIIDHFEGQKDLRQKCVKAIGVPAQRFEEDVVRILRAIRFSSRLGFTIEEKTLKEIENFSSKMSAVAWERVLKELKKMASGNGTQFAHAIELLAKTGVLREIIPELLQLQGLEQNADHHPEGNVWEHTLAALKCSNSQNPLVNFAILFHDIGKIGTHSDENGKHSYHGHEKESSKMFRMIAKRLKMSNSDIEAIDFAILNHMKFHRIPEMKLGKVAKLIGDKNFEVLQKVAEADTKCRLHAFKPESWQKVQDKIGKASQKMDIAKDLPSVSGKMIMQILGIPPGPKVGIVKKAVGNEILEFGMPQDLEGLVRRIGNEIS